MTTDYLAKMNSITKYPSIQTLHAKQNNGSFTGEVRTVNRIGEKPVDALILTEKIDGTNARIIVKGGRTFIGSREELLTCLTDTVANKSMGIVEALRVFATRIGALPRDGDAHVTVYYLEVFGGKIGQKARTYTATPEEFGFAVFDIATYSVDMWRAAMEMADAPENVSVWRDKVIDNSILGKRWMPEVGLIDTARQEGFALVPRHIVPASYITIGVEAMHVALHSMLSYVTLDGAKPEGFVVRTASRSGILKARTEDYDDHERRKTSPRHQSKARQRNPEVNANG